MLKNREGVSALEGLGSYSQSSWKRVPWTCSVGHHVEYLPNWDLYWEGCKCWKCWRHIVTSSGKPKPSYLPLLCQKGDGIFHPAGQCSNVDYVLYNYTVLHLLVFEDALEKSGAWESWEIERLGLGPTSVWISFIFLLLISILDRRGNFHVRFFYSSKNTLCQLPSWLNQIVQISYE